MQRFFSTFLSIIATLAAASASAQAPSQAENAKALRPYMAPRAVSRLEWDLMQFNMLWAGSFDGSAGYLTSFPVIFDEKRMRFHAVLHISEIREYKDPDPWSGLPRIKKESVLQGAVDHLLAMLEKHFPEVRSRPTLLLIEFKYGLASGGSINAARYDGGRLTLSE